MLCEVLRKQARSLLLLSVLLPRHPLHEKHVYSPQNLLPGVPWHTYVTHFKAVTGCMEFEVLMALKMSMLC
jgi:hypothetical protein